VIDLHAHILPGFDDGVRSLEEARELARAAVREGVTAIAATPHVRSDYPTTADEMERGVAELRRAVADAAIPLELRTGGELALERLGSLLPDELRRFALGEGRRYLLVETPYYGWPIGIPDLFFRLRAAGVTPILAHPERNGEVQASPERLGDAVELGALVQVTAALVTGQLGRRARARAVRLIGLGLAHLLASDAHGPSTRAVGMSAAARALGDDTLAEWLTRAVPAAIVGNWPIPDRPGRVRRRRWLRLRARAEG
jgi:protein-tyrosine phosphatase